MTLKERKQHQQNNRSSCNGTECAQALRFSPLVFVLIVLENGTPVIIRSSIYVESFGNIEEANMVSFPLEVE